MQIIDIGKRIYSILEPRQRRASLALVPMMVIRAVFDTVGVATVLPFIAVVGDPAEALQNRYLSLVYTAFGFQTVNRFLFFLGGLALVALLSSSALTVATEFLVKRFVMRQSHSLQRRLMLQSLSRPYATFLSKHSGEMGQSILSEVTQFVDGILSPYMILIARFIATLVLLGLLVAIDPILAFSTGAALAGLYVVIFLVVRNVLNRIGKERQQADAVRYKTVSETYGGIKDVKVSGRELTFLDKFAAAARRHAALDVIVHVTRVVPKHLLEVVAFSGIIGIVLYLLSSNRPMSAVLSVVTLYAFACYRLIPAVQQIYEATTRLRYYMPALNAIERLAQEDEVAVPSLVRATPRGIVARLEFRNVNHAYPSSERQSISNVNLTLKEGTSTAIVGATGSGKSTLLDVMLGLLEPTTGGVFIDGEPLQGTRVREWQAAVGYVPQQPFLSDDTVAANIAFGVPKREVDLAAVEHAARLAQIHDFITDLPDGYETRIGERGVRLSGGQRQRLGIARALYSDPTVLVLDEATSALDNSTEAAVFAGLAELTGSRTIVTVTHRIAAVSACDMIVLVEQGRVVAQGSYDTLLGASAAFRALAQTSPEPQIPV